MSRNLRDKIYKEFSIKIDKKIKQALDNNVMGAAEAYIISKEILISVLWEDEWLGNERYKEVADGQDRRNDS